MNKLDMASISFSSFQFGFSFKCNSVTGYRLQVDRVGFGCKMVSVDGSIQSMLRISEKN